MNAREHRMKKVRCDLKRTKGSARMFRFLLSIFPLKGWPRFLANQAVDHLRQHRRKEPQQRHNSIGRFNRQCYILAAVCLFQTHLSCTLNTVCDVIVGLLTKHDDYSIAVNLIPFIDNSYERQFTFLNLRTEFSSEDLESDRPALVFTVEIIKELRPFVFRNFSGLHC